MTRSELDNALLEAKEHSMRIDWALPPRWNDWKGHV